MKIISINHIRQNMDKQKYYYAVRKGRVTGVYDNPEEARKQTDGFSRYDMKKFESSEEAWEYVHKPYPEPENGGYYLPEYICTDEEDDYYINSDFDYFDVYDYFDYYDYYDDIDPSPDSD